jgi:hypothetical protein
VNIEALSGRFARLVAAFEAGVLPAPRTGGGGHRGRRAQSHKPVRPQYGDPTIPSRLPSKFGWLIEAAPDSAAFVGQVEAWLEHPDLPVLLAEAPQAEAYLRPLLRMLGIKPGPALVAARAREEAGRRERREARAALLASSDWEALTGLPPLDSPFWSPENLPPVFWPPDQAEADPVLPPAEPGFFEPD